MVAYVVKQWKSSAVEGVSVCYHADVNSIDIIKGVNLYLSISSSVEAEHIPFHVHSCSTSYCSIKMNCDNFYHQICFLKPNVLISPANSVNTVNSLYCKHPGVPNLVSLIAIVHSSGDSF